MSSVIQTIRTKGRGIAALFTLLLAGRAMTLAYVFRAGGPSEGDPPAAWLMPLTGDALIGVSALVVVYLLWKKEGVAAWAAVVVWNSVAIWDALSAFLIHTSVPWPSFFMVEIFGSSMFFAASLMHAFCLYLVCQKSVRSSFFPQLGESEASGSC